MACGDFGVVSTSAPGHPPGLSVCLLSGFMCWPHTIQFLSSTCAVTCSFVSCPVHVYLPYTCAALSFIYFTFAWPRLPGHGLPLPTQNDCAGVEEVMDGLQITYLFFIYLWTSTSIQIIIARYYAASVVDPSSGSLGYFVVFYFVITPTTFILG